MYALHGLPEQVTQRLAWVLVHFVWQGAAVAGLLALTLWLGRVKRPSVRYALRLVALAVMVACPVITFVVFQPVPEAENVKPLYQPKVATIAPRDEPFASGRSITEGSSRGAMMATLKGTPSQDSLEFEAEFGTEILETQSRPAHPTDFAVQQTDASVELFTPEATRARSNWSRVQPWIVSGWLFGVALFSLRLLLGWLGVWRLRRRVEPVPEWLTARVHSLSQAMRVTRPLIHLSQRVTEAVAVGFLKPMILLPVAWVTELQPDMIEAVLAHELAHIRRGDLWVNLIQRLVETLLFYHPAVWWLSRELRIDRELCCDELVVRTLHNPLRYAETLEHIGRLSLANTRGHARSSLPSRSNLTVSIGSPRPILLARIRAILAPPPPPQARDTSAWLAGLIPLVVACLIGCSLISRSTAPANEESQPNKTPDATSIVRVTSDDEPPTTEALPDSKAPASAEQVGGEAVKAELRQDQETSVRQAQSLPDLTHRELDQKVDEALMLSMQRRMWADRHSPWQIGCWAMAFGREGELRWQDASRERVSVVDWFASGPKFDGEPVWLKTEWGGRAHPYTRMFTFEGHPDQFLAWLTSADLPKEFAFKLESGTDQKITVQDVLNDAKQRVNDNESITWTLWAMSHYEAFDSEWKNAAGSEWSISRMVEMQVKEPVVGGPDGGTPGLFVLAKARRRYTEQALQANKPLPAIWGQVNEKLDRYIAVTKQLQNPDGSLSAKYLQESRFARDLNQHLNTTGSGLSWVIAALPDERLRDTWLTRAIEDLCEGLISAKAVSLDTAPLAKAVHALRLYRERTRGLDLKDLKVAVQSSRDATAAEPATPDIKLPPVAGRPAPTEPLGPDQREMRIKPRGGKDATFTVSNWTDNSVVPPLSVTVMDGGIEIEIDEGNGLQLRLQADKVTMTKEVDREVIGVTGTARSLVSTPMKVELKGKVLLEHSRRPDATPVAMTAERMEIDLVAHTVTAEGSVTIVREEGSLKADRVRLDFGKGTVRLDGANAQKAPLALDLSREDGGRGDKTDSAKAADRAAEKALHLIKLRQDRIAAHDKAAAAKLVGEWKVTMPKGFVFQGQLEQQPDGLLKLSNARAFNGAYAIKGNRLELVDAPYTKARDFVWLLQPDGRFKLIEEDHGSGADYVGAVLERVAVNEPANVTTNDSPKTSDSPPKPAEAVRANPFVGSIIEVDRAKGTLVIDRGERDGLPVLMKFDVYPKGTKQEGFRPTGGIAEIQVTRILDAGRAEARITMNNEMPGVGDLLWKPRLEPKPGQTGHGVVLSVRGRVMIDGPIPEVPPLKIKPSFRAIIPRNPEESLKNAEREQAAPVVEIPDDSLVISKEGGVAYVAVYLKKAPKDWKPTPPPGEPVVIEAVKHRFTPHFSFIRAGQPLTLVNSMNEAVNFHSQPLRETPQNQLANSRGELLIKSPYTQSESLPHQFVSDIQHWMKGYLLALDHPFAAITDADGRFEIRDLPPGLHHFIVWHERRGYLNKDLVVRVEGDKVSEVDLKYTAGDLERRDAVNTSSIPNASQPGAGPAEAKPSYLKEYSRLFQEQKFAEAALVAKRAKESEPDSPVVPVLLKKAIAAKRLAESDERKQDRSPITEREVELLMLREARQEAHEREAAAKLVGRWKLTLPAGFVHEVELKQNDDGLLNLTSEKNLTLQGRFAVHGPLMELVQPNDKAIQDFVWQIRAADQLILTTDENQVGAKYLGAKLERM